MKISRLNNRLETDGGFLNYTIDDSEITLDLVCVEIQRKGIGTALVEELQSIATEIDLPIGLYAEPWSDCTSEISEESLISFYENLGFEKDSDDIDGKLLIWK
jgi:GNAT superfamily N-acetyltransferase